MQKGWQQTSLHATDRWVKKTSTDFPFCSIIAFFLFLFYFIFNCQGCFHNLGLVPWLTHVVQATTSRFHLDLACCAAPGLLCLVPHDLCHAPCLDECASVSLLCVCVFALPWWASAQSHSLGFTWTGAMQVCRLQTPHTSAGYGYRSGGHLGSPAKRIAVWALTFIKLSFHSCFKAWIYLKTESGDFVSFFSTWVHQLLSKHSPSVFSVLTVTSVRFKLIPVHNLY